MEKKKKKKGKDDNTIVVYDYSPQIYPRRLFVMKGCGIKDVTDRFCNRDNSDIEYEVEIGSEPAMTVFPMIKFKDTGAYGELVAIWVDPKDVTVSMIAHEAGHVALDILSDVGVKFHADNQEPITYLVGWVAQCVHDVITGEADKND